MSDDVKAQATALIRAVAAIGAVIKEAGPQGVPSGIIYAAVMQHMDLSKYQFCVGVLKREGLVRESGHVLTWCGPPDPPAPAKG